MVVPPIRSAALVIVVMDIVLMSGFFYISFTEKNLALGSRFRILRRLLAMSVPALFLLLLKSSIDLLWQTVLASNLILFAGIVWQVCRKPLPHERRRDPSWLKTYADKLIEELEKRRAIERELAYMASMAERDPNCLIEMDRNGVLGYRNAATDQTFPDLAAKGKEHPVLAGLNDVMSILQRDGKPSLRRPFRYEERVFEQQITWSAETRKLCLYMTDVTEWKRLDELKTELLNTVSHEFRSPLSSILAATSLIQNDMLGPVTQDQRKMLSMVDNSANRLNRLITDFLDISKIEAGKFELRREEVELADLVENVALSFTPVAKARGIDVTTDIGSRPIYCLADSDKIVQVLTNLTNNALKFTPAGRITLGIQATPEEVRFTVQDTGVGISPDQRHRVFGKFQQFGPAVRGEKGTGLGLSLCKSLVELHRGKISVESVLGKGTTFAFTIPRLTAQAVFNDELQRLYLQAASAGRCLSAFILAVDEAPNAGPFPGKLELAKKLEGMVRQRFRSERDIALRAPGQVYFILDAVNKSQAKTIVDDLVKELIPVAAAAHALDQVVVRAQFACLPDDGTILEGLQDRLSA